MFRWATEGRGPRRRKLRVVTVPGGLCTTRGWLEEYLAAFTVDRERRRGLRVRTERQRRAERRRAEKVLDAAGVV